MYREEEYKLMFRPGYVKPYVGESISHEPIPLIVY